jgi:hypothetical protein
MVLTFLFEFCALAGFPVAHLGTDPATLPTARAHAATRAAIGSVGVVHRRMHLPGQVPHDTFGTFLLTAESGVDAGARHGARVTFGAGAVQLGGGDGVSGAAELGVGVGEPDKGAVLDEAFEGFPSGLVFEDFGLESTNLRTSQPSPLASN